MNRENMTRCMRDGCTHQQAHEINNYIDNLEKCYCNRSDCSGRIKDSKKYDSLQQRIDKAINYIDMIYEIGSYSKSKGLDDEEVHDLLKILQGND